MIILFVQVDFDEGNMSKAFHNHSILTIMHRTQCVDVLGSSQFRTGKPQTEVRSQPRKPMPDDTALEKQA